MLHALLLFLIPVQPAPSPVEPEWVMELVVEAWGQQITLRLPAKDYLECEELRDIWLTDGPRDTEDFRSESDCVPAQAE